MLLTADADDLERYSRDWSGDHYGMPLAVARPRSVEEVSLLMRCCSASGHPCRAAGRADRPRRCRGCKPPAAARW
jgi:FAD/FMN-containing dehydrogenase